MKQAYIYIMTNDTNKVLYTGVTTDLIGRIYQHKEGIIEGFTKKHNVKKLVYYEVANDITSAIVREKQIKGGSRKKKVELIISMNPSLVDLYSQL